MRFLTISFFIFIFSISQAEAQVRMKNSRNTDRMLNTKSYGFLVRQQNPSNLNFTGRIEGTEVKRNQYYHYKKLQVTKKRESEYKDGDPIDYSFLDQDKNTSGFQEF